MSKPTLLGAAITAGLAGQADASDIRVTVTGIDDAGGRIGCSLHSAATDFPMGQNAVEVMRLSAGGRTATCVWPSDRGMGRVAQCPPRPARPALRGSRL